jgi:hypothetical protein
MVHRHHRHNHHPSSSRYDRQNYDLNPCVHRDLELVELDRRCQQSYDGQKDRGLGIDRKGMFRCLHHCFEDEC